LFKSQIYPALFTSRANSHLRLFASSGVARRLVGKHLSGHLYFIGNNKVKKNGTQIGTDNTDKHGFFYIFS
jgi:hypothetical protein